jgi:hypothetical protein
MPSKRWWHAVVVGGMMAFLAATVMLECLVLACRTLARDAAPASD